MGFPGEPDYDVEEIAKEAGIGKYYPVICEGCGMSGVGQDDEGNIIVFNESHEQEKWDPDEDRMDSFEGRARRKRLFHSVKENPELIVEAFESLNSYVFAQGKMLNQWVEGNEAVKQRCWQRLHACEEKAREVLTKSGYR